MGCLSSEDVKRQLLTKLGCVEESGDHHYYSLYDNGILVARTKISRGSKHSIGDTLIYAMTRQMRLGTSSNFKKMVSCSLSREECLAIIRNISVQRS